MVAKKKAVVKKKAAPKKKRAPARRPSLRKGSGAKKRPARKSPPKKKAAPRKRSAKRREMIVEQVGFVWGKGGAFVLLREKSGKRRLAIFVGFHEMAGILSSLGGVDWGNRPLTYDLMSNLLEELSGDLRHIEVTEVRDTTYYAKLVVDDEGDVTEIDSRPSDAIAVAVRQGCPILVHDQLIAKSGAPKYDNVSVFWPFADPWPPPLDG